MQDIIELRFTHDQIFNTEENKSQLTNVFYQVILAAKSSQIWDNSVEKIIITDNFINDIAEQANAWNSKDSVTQEKEGIVLSKVLFNNDYSNPKNIIFFDLRFLFSEGFSHIRMIYSQLLNVFSQNIFPLEIRNHEFLKGPATLENNVKFLAVGWCKEYFTKKSLDNVFGKDGGFESSQKPYLTAFKRKLKRSLFDYNSDKFDHQTKLNIFHREYFDSLDILFLRLINFSPIEESLKIPETENSKTLIENVLFEIKNLTESCSSDSEFNVTKLKESIKNFSAHFEVFLVDETETNFRIKLTKNPKDYFIGEIVETEPRIICFMDILGFSELINEYESDLTSTLLQDIQESFALAKTQLLENQDYGLNSESIKHLKYQTFSDNICISIPYFDNEEDFLVNFNLLSIYIRGFQLIMMTKGIFMRGGISTGSYYADENIIFSKGLVNAYYLESKKAIYPRVIIDNSILQKLLNYSKERIQYYGIDKTIVIDWENSGFLNPFGISETAINQMEKMIDSLELDDDHDAVSKIANSLSKTISELTLSLIKSNIPEEKNSLNQIKSTIRYNISINTKNDNIASKYIWLLEFIKWLEIDNEAKLKFSYFADQLH